MSSSFLKVVVMGSSGFVGNPLVCKLSQEGVHVICISGRDFFSFPQNYDSVISGADCLINLSGERITPFCNKKRVRESRVTLTEKIVELFKRISNPPKRFLSASAIGYYGDRAEELLTEDSSPGRGFLSNVCVDWEEKAFLAKELGISTCSMRFGIILDKSGGIIHSIKRVSFLGRVLGIGTRTQKISWVYLDDVINSIYFLLLQKDIEGPVNIVGASSSVEEFYQKIADILGFKYVCSFGNTYLKKLFLNILSQSGELFFYSQNVFSKKLLSKGFIFKNI